MKLRNLLIAIVAIHSFMACSGDEDVIVPVNPEETETATLSVRIEDLRTKGVGDSNIDDKTITDLCVLIFKGMDQSAALEKIGWAKKVGDQVVEDIPTTSGNKKVIVLANVSGAQLRTLGIEENKVTYSEVMGKSLSFSEREQNGTLSMNSCVYDLTLRASMKNYLGYGDKTVSETGTETLVTVPVGVNAKAPVSLYRNVAQVVLEKINLEASENNRYPDSRLLVKEVFILHGHRDTKLMGDGTEWSTTNITSSYLNGATNDRYAGWVNHIQGIGNITAETLFKYLLKGYAGWFGQPNTYMESYPNGQLITATSSTFPVSPSFYVYENTDTDLSSSNCTLLVIKADFIYKNVRGEDVVAANRYYSIAVGLSGMGDGYKLPDGFTARRGGAELYKGVLRNLCYKVSFTVKGPGYDTPFTRDETMLGVSCTVTFPYVSYTENVGGDY